MEKDQSIEERITNQQAACEFDLRDLLGYVALDYEAMEELYGRADGKLVGDESELTDRNSGSSDAKYGTKCASCPARLAGCAIRSALQEVAAEHRAKYETAISSGGGSNTSAEHEGIDGWYDSGWQQTG